MGNAQRDDWDPRDASVLDDQRAAYDRMREECPTGYNDAALDAFAKRAKRWRKDGRDAYIFMINGAKVRAPAAALALSERLR